MIAGAVVSATYGSASPYTVARGVDAIRTIADRAGGYIDDMAFQTALFDDFHDLDDASAPGIVGIPLWPGGSPPPWIVNRWERLKRELIKTGVGWEAWAGWYEDRLSGTTRSERRERAYVEVPEEFWADGAARVNTWIHRKIEADSLSQVAPAGASDGDGAAVFDQRPAAFHFYVARRPN